ncbi:trimeric intracellular cation channel family protein [Trinickia caryophylli]|uniref:trimeric intracellular cation channel family protein n=1 Tax=Trinickia caryophylli TaxID=28094 RepID=UPI000A14B99E|nr:trimeric intracellular cation channel family protein [Trinickia caryophylli]PMS09126.1 trimeric intracellular cation channel family protein [Trinickia caryophylli]TRX19988.1 trimeric intracellular cation channel family protein [Trinickia caryophylli]WQE12672.1 trimeric intracellular cation channel family protein [Trinickia caryophylli]
MHPRLTLALSIVEALAIFAFAVSGFIEARKRRLDAVGTFLVALVTAFGGGTVRDVLLSRRPFYWVEHQTYVIAIFVLSFFAPLMLRMASRVLTERALLIADAIGLGLFSVSGTSIALEAGMPWFISAMMGVVTGVFGGIIRDVLCNDVPLILKDSRPYATCAFAGCGLFLLLSKLDFDPVYSVVAATGFILVARLVTYKLDVRLPH